MPVNSEQVIDELSENTLGPVMVFAEQNFKYEEGAYMTNNAIRAVIATKGSRHSLKNVKTAIGHLDSRIDIQARRNTSRGVSNVAPSEKIYFNSFPWKEGDVISGEQARRERKESFARLLGKDNNEA